MQAGWYPDPMGRFEFRYFNGTAWTADVATDGARQIDQLGTAPTPVAPPPSSAGPGIAAGGFAPTAPTNGLSTAAMVLGIVGVALGLLMVLFWVAIPLGILALVLGLVARRRARASGIGRPQALAGVIMGPIAIGLGMAGLVLLWPDLRDAFRDATRQLDGTAAVVEIEECRVADGVVRATGVVRNRTSVGHTVEIEIAVLPPGSSTPLTVIGATVFDLGADQERPFEASGALDADPDAIRCTVDRVSVG